MFEAGSRGQHLKSMQLWEHVQITGGALKRWFLAASYDALCVAAIWLVGLLIIGVPWAPFWAILGGLLQFIPQIGPVIAFIGPALAALISGGFERFVYVLILFAVIAVVDGFVLQPYFMRRTAKVPIWASILTPLVLGFFFTWWLVLIAAPLLVIVFSYRALFRERRAQRLGASEPEILPPAR